MSTKTEGLHTESFPLFFWLALPLLASVDGKTKVHLLYCSAEMQPNGLSDCVCVKDRLEFVQPQSSVSMLCRWIFTLELSILKSWNSDTRASNGTILSWRRRNFKSLQNQAVRVTGQQPVRPRLNTFENTFLIDTSPICLMRTMLSELIRCVERHGIGTSVLDANLNMLICLKCSVTLRWSAIWNSCKFYT